MDSLTWTIALLFAPEAKSYYHMNPVLRKAGGKGDSVTDP